MKSTECRFQRPGAKLHCTTRYQGELRTFYEQDEEAAELFEALLRRAQLNGLDPDENSECHLRRAEEQSHRAPVGFQAFRKRRPNLKPLPWLGEILTNGSDAVDDRGPFWRGYFSDLRASTDRLTEIDDVLMASVRAKGGKDGVKAGEQDVHLTDAGEAVMRWCKKQPHFTYRIQ